MRFLHLRLEAPLMAFGTATVDEQGVIGRFPAASMLTGLLANALGWRHGDAARLDRLQARLVFGARIDRPGVPLVDFQTAEIEKDDAAWTTSGVPARRAGGAASYNAPLLRYRHYWADAAVSVVLALAPADEAPTLEAIATALDHPARPLFIGRKPCVPTGPLLAGTVEAADVPAALVAAPLDGRDILDDDPVSGPCRRLAMWPLDAATAAAMADDRGVRVVTRADHRDWRNQVHGGQRYLAEGLVATSPGGGAP